MAVSEVNAILSILEKVCKFANTIQDRYYKSSKEVASFRSKCLVLEKKHAEWQEQLRKFGVEVKSNGLQDLASEAHKIQEEQIREVAKLEGSRFRRWRKTVSGMAFPTRLTDVLARMEEIVGAGPKLLQSKVDNHALLEQHLSQTPAPLTFGFDDKYVPILETVDEVQTALENERVVTLYGIPGLGKTSLAKYLALKYTAEKDHGMNQTPPQTPRFHDGVHYMFCGKGSQDKVKELLQGLLEHLGFATTSAASSNGASSQAVISSLQRKLALCLANQTMLIIFDDLWEPAALEQLLVPASGVKYLITSQNRGICRDAKKIELKKPTREEAVQILANHTSGLPTKGEFPDSIRDVTNGIMRQLENHPLSLSNIGMSVDGSKATDVRHWEAKKDDLLGVLGAPTEVIGQPSVFNSTYNLPVKASMMVMVDSLVEEARSILFLMALFKERLVNEELLKFFYSLFLRKAHVSSTYDMYVKYLKDMLVIESQSRGIENMLLVHGLRMRYIQEEKDEELKNIACQIRPGIIDERKAELIRTGDSEETLAAFLGAAYFRGAFREMFAGALEEHSRIMLYGKLYEGNGDALKNIRPFLRYSIIPKVFPFLNFDGGRGDSEQQAHRYAKKIFIKFLCQRTVDDHSMAGLLQLSEGTAKACNLLKRIIQWVDWFSASLDVNPLGETLKVLFVHLDKNPTWDVITTIGEVLKYEGNDDTVLSILAKWGDILRADPNPPIQLAIMETIPPRVAFRLRFKMRLRSPGTIALLINGISELVGVVIVSGKDDELRLAAVRTMNELINSNTIVPWRLAVTPAALTKVLDLFISGKTLKNVEIAGATLGKLAVFPENRRIYRAVNGSLESLCDILAKMEGTWRATLREEDRRIVEKQGSLSAGILAELATEKELRETIASLPGLKDGLLFLQLVEMGKLATEPQERIEDKYFYFYTLNSTKALTTLCSTSASKYTDLPPFEQVLDVFSSDEMPSDSPIVYLSLYWSRVEAHLRMGTYGMVLANLDLADTLLNSTPEVYLRVSCPWSNLGSRCPAAKVLSKVREFVKAMLGDTCALGAYEGVTVKELWRLVDRGVLKRLIGDFRGALEDLNLAFESCTRHQEQYSCLKHRGYVRHLMGNDEEGARKDAESANQLKLQGLAVEVDYNYISRFWTLREQPVEYLGFAL